jgi:hypothetical protein
MSDPKFQLERVRAPVTDEELIEDIQRVAELAGTKVVSFRLYSEVGNYHPTTAALRFGTWNKALLARASVWNSRANGERWSATIHLVVAGGKLIWTGRDGTETQYFRCH